MRRSVPLAVLGSFLLATFTSRAEDITKRVRKAVEEATLDQPGTPPFHLKATLAPSIERDKDSDRTGEVEIWWAAPDHWKREVRSPQFHQIEIVNGTSDWQKNEGEIFPEWLRQIAVALIRPAPDMELLLDRIRSSDVRDLMGTTHASWTIQGTDGAVMKTIGAGLYLRPDNSLEFASDLGWNASLDKAAPFHSRKVARKVSGEGIGGPEVTATVTTLEDLALTPELFAPTGESGPRLQTVILNEEDARKNLLADTPLAWPSMKDGPLEGVVISEVLVDTHGKVAEVGTTLSDNPGLIDAADQHIREMRFKPYVVGGNAALVVTTVTMPFKTTRPTGMENFDAARNYFELGRKIGFPATRGAAYVLAAQFQARGASGTVETGTYTDTFVSETQWRREAMIKNSRFVRARNGEKYYVQSEGPAARLLGLILTLLEPIPAIDTFVESDWRIQREQWNGISTVRVASGHENPDGTPDPAMFRGYWFDDSGQLVRAYLSGLEIQRSDFTQFDGVQVAQRIDVLKDGHLALQMTTTSMSATQASDAKLFVLKGHEWLRRFTAETR